jgi:UDP-N-acetylglucosamine 3-dehydrogenase
LSDKGKDMPRVAVIGAGAMGRNHLRVLNEMGGADLVAVGDADEATAERSARFYRVPAFTDHRALLAEAKPDAVVVSVPTNLHYGVVMDALHAGVHVLVEKPIASTEDEAREMIAAAHDRGVVLTVGHIERYNPVILELYRRLRAGELGRVFKMHARRLGPFPPRVRDVGVVIDLATHDVDIMRFLSGSEVTRLYAETARRIHTEHEDLLSGLLRFGDDTIGVLDINWLTPTKIRELLVTGERGMFQANYLTQELFLYENNYASSGWDDISRLEGVTEGDMHRPRIEKAEPLRVELERFMAAVRGEPDVEIVSGEEGLAALRIARAIVESGMRGEALRLA